VLAALACLLAVGCVRHKPVIYLDHQWSAYYAKNSCYLYLPKGDRDPQLQECVSRQMLALEMFERSLLPQFASEPTCAGQVTPPRADQQAAPADTRFWRLLINLEDSGGRREHWDLMNPNGSAIAHGVGDSEEVARQVCAIVSGHAPAGG